MLDENLLFITLIIVFLVFIIKRQFELIAIGILVYLAYLFYKSRFTNPREFLLWFKNKATEAFQPCTNENQAYCGNETNSNMTFLPSYLRGMAVDSNTINNSQNVVLKPEDYQIDKRMKLGTAKQITVEEMIQVVPILLDYKLYLEKIVKFTLGLKTDDPIQKNFLAKKLRHKMTKIFYNAYNTVNEKIYPIQSYNELLLAEREFDDTINIFIFLGLNELDSYNLAQLQKEFQELNKKLNQFTVDKVNQVSPNDYNIYYSRLPESYEPQGISKI
jgi:Ca2+/Na+ antiporter